MLTRKPEHLLTRKEECYHRYIRQYPIFWPSEWQTPEGPTLHEILEVLDPGLSIEAFPVSYTNNNITIGDI